MKQREKRYQKDMQKLRPVTNLYLYAMFGFFPLMVVDYTAITYTKYVTFLVLSLVYAGITAFTLGGMVLDGYRPGRRHSHRWWTQPGTFLLAFLLVGLLSFLCSPYRGMTNGEGQSLFLFGSGRYDGYLLYLIYGAVFWLASRFGDFQKGHLTVVAVVTIVMTAIGIVQLCGINLFNLYPYYTGRLNNFISTVGNLGMFSGMMCVFIPLLVTGYLLLEHRRWVSGLLLAAQTLAVYVMLTINVSAGKVALIVTLAVLLPLVYRQMPQKRKLLDFLAVLAVAGAVKSGVQYHYDPALAKTTVQISPGRATWLLLGVVAVLLSWRCLCGASRISGWFRQRRVRAVVMVLVLCIGLVGTCGLVAGSNTSATPTENAVIRGDTLLDEIKSLFTKGLVSASGNGRVAIWRAAWRMGLEHPLLGTGIGTFYVSFRECIEGVRQFKGFNAIDTAHNEYLHLFCTVGGLGLLAYLGFWLSLAVRAWKARRKNPYVLMLTAAVLGYSIQAFFSFNIVIMTPLLWLCGGLLYKKIRKEESSL